MKWKMKGNMEKYSLVILNFKGSFVAEHDFVYIQDN